ncbi:MAG: SUMF1/EgtB/PvdO family nonheme iron enzyme [Gammaproteobacteria bacterium]
MPPQDGSAWREADGSECDRRVVRGGSWFINPQVLRSAYRVWFGTSGANYSGLGFRLARAL